MLVQGAQHRPFRANLDPGDAGIVYPQPSCNRVLDVKRPGNRRLDRAHVRHDDDGPFYGVVREVIASRSDTFTQFGERLATIRSVGDVRVPAIANCLWHRVRMHPLESPVVQLDPALVDLDGRAEGVRGAARPLERARNDTIGWLQARRQPSSLTDAPGRQRRIGSSEEDALDIGCGLTVAHQVEHLGTLLRRGA
jgi:hypothetical protein